MRYLFALLVLVIWPTAASADWHKASSDHFIIYADQSEKDVRMFAEQLEYFHRALELVTGTDLPPPSPSSRVTIFAMGSTRAVQKLFGDGGDDIGGFYNSRASGSVAFVSKVKPRYGRKTDYSMRVLLHEYAHYFQLSNIAFPVPRWFGEGAAEFVSSARFPAKGRVDMGVPDGLRMSWIVYGDKVRVHQILDPDADEVEAGPFYAKSWIMYHYLARGKGREGQLDRYLQALASGMGQLEAAEHAFGDLDQLDRDVRYYRLLRTWDALAARGLEIGKVNIRRLREGEAAIMPWLARSKRGVNKASAREVLLGVQPIASQFPEDPFVLSELVEAEYDAGNDEAAIAAADRALALNPGQVNAYVQKGYALFRIARQADDKEAAYNAAVAPFLALNKIENDHPLPLYYYYQSFLERGVEPPELAVMGLQQALGLAPYDDGLRLTLVRRQIEAQEYDQARLTLAPVAYAPHQSKLVDRAKDVMVALARKPALEPSDLLEMLQGEEDEENTEEEGEEV